MNINIVSIFFVFFTENHTTINILQRCGLLVKGRSAIQHLLDSLDMEGNKLKIH